MLINADDLYSHFISSTSPYAAPEPPTLSAISRGTAEHTPNISKLAEEGATFSSAYSSSSMCSPSRYSLLTGRYSSGHYDTAKSQQVHGAGRTYVSVPWTYLEGNDITENLPTALRECGYKSGAVGKWYKRCERSEHIELTPGRANTWTSERLDGRTPGPSNARTHSRLVPPPCIRTLTKESIPLRCTLRFAHIPRSHRPLPLFTHVCGPRSRSLSSQAPYSGG